MKILSQKNKWATINIIGIAIAFAAILLVSTYTIHELSFDKFHSKADNIYRLNVDKPGRVGFMETADNLQTASLNGYYTSSLYDYFPEIKDVTLLTNTYNLSLKVGAETYSIEKSFYTDHSFFNLFDFNLLQGNKNDLFKNTNEIVLSKKAALKYFGDTKVIGKEVKIKSEYDNNDGTSYTVKAVFDDFPSNSHMTFNLLISEKTENLQSPYGTAFTYLLLQKESNPIQLADALNLYWEKNVKESELAPTFKLMNLKDIHLKSHMRDELGSNGNLNSIIILVIGALIVFLIAIVNYSNLNFVQFTTNLKDLKIKIINGASLLNLSTNQIGVSLFHTCIAIVIGTLIAINFDNISNFNLQFNFSIKLFLCVSIFFAILFSFIALLPLYTKNISNNLSKTPDQGSKKFIISLVFQFVLSISAIILTMVLHKQVDYIQKTHPGEDKESILTISNFPYEAIAKFDLLKEKVQQHSEIEYLSSTFMPPGIFPDFEHSFEMEGIENSKENRIMINSVEKDFFKLFNIKALVGNLELQNGSDFIWECKAITPNSEIALQNLEKLDPIHKNFKEQYILNESAVKKLGFKNPEDAIGRQFQYHFRAPRYFKKGEIVAVIKDLHYADLFSKELPMVIGLKRIFNGTFLVKINKNKKAEAIQKLTKEWNQLFPDSLMKCKFLDDIYAEIYKNQYKEMKALTLFAILSILLSILGMFALSSYSIQHKTKEIGIRKANGASSLEIMIQLIREYAIWVALAFIIACPLAYYTAEDWLQHFAYKTDLSWWIFALAGIIALIIAIVTVSWQTWNAARKDPIYALKYE